MSKLRLTSWPYLCLTKSFEKASGIITSSQNRLNSPNPSLPKEAMIAFGDAIECLKCADFAKAWVRIGTNIRIEGLKCEGLGSNTGNMFPKRFQNTEKELNNDITRKKDIKTVRTLTEIREDLHDLSSMFDESTELEELNSEVAQFYLDREHLVKYAIDRFRLSKYLYADFSGALRPLNVFHEAEKHSSLLAKACNRFL